MTITEIRTPVETPVGEVEPSAPKRVPTRRFVALGAAAIVSVATFAVVSQNSAGETGKPPATVAPRSMDQITRDLVDRGLIPRQTLEPAPLTMDQITRDLVDRGLIPRETLEPAPAPPVAMIFGPAHPLGAPDSGIPCSALVYTRC